MIKMRQITLDKKKNTAFLDLNSFFYPRHLLQFAKAEFSKNAQISFSQENGRTKVEIKPKGKASAEETALYFCNYALGLKQEFGDHA